MRPLSDENLRESHRVGVLEGGGGGSGVVGGGGGGVGWWGGGGDGGRGGGGGGFTYSGGKDTRWNFHRWN